MCFENHCKAIMPTGVESNYNNELLQENNIITNDVPVCGWTYNLKQGDILHPSDISNLRF